jgi:hypothetical protein
MLSCQSARNKACVCQVMKFVFFFFDILLIYYLCNVNLHEIPKFVYLPATYNVAVK